MALHRRSAVATVTMTLTLFLSSGQAWGQCTTVPPFLEDETALDFDGVDDFIKVPSASGLVFDAGASITLEAWVYPDSITAFGNVITKSADTTVNYALRYETDGSIGFFYRNLSDTTWFEFNSAGGVVAAGRWQHIAVSHTFATADIMVYVDGKAVSGAWSGIPGEGPMTTGETLLFGGSSINPGDIPSRLVDGRIDEIRIWDVTRSARDIAANTSTILIGDEPGLVGYWRFEGGTGSSAEDIAGGHDGTLIGATWTPLDECAPPCPEDIDDTGDVAFTDLLAILATWGPCAGCSEDLDESGDVGFTDLLSVLGGWGPCPVATGGCCVPDACLDLTADECIAMGGTYNAGTSCADIGCPSSDGWIVTAPLTWAGDTCGDPNLCDLGDSPDVQWEITIETPGSWTFSVCDSLFDTVLALGSTPCSDDLADGDDECEVASEIQIDLEAGTYFLTLEGFSSGQCGPYALVVTER